MDLAGTSESSPLPRVECSDACSKRYAELESDVRLLRSDIVSKENALVAVRRELWLLKEEKQAQEKKLASMQNDFIILENHLNAERRARNDINRSWRQAKQQFCMRTETIRRQSEKLNALRRKALEMVYLTHEPPEIFEPVENQVIWEDTQDGNKNLFMK